MRYSYDSIDKKPMFKQVLKEVIIWILEIVIVIGIAFLIINFGAKMVTVESKSMQTTLNDGDKILVNKFVYKLGKPNRFDVIVFKQNGGEHSYYNVKRIIALPGETVQIKSGEIYVNDKKLKEKRKHDKIENGGLAEDKIKLDENEYFVLGDNRNNSEDSRFANIGNIVKGDIAGKALFKMNHFSLVK